MAYLFCCHNFYIASSVGFPEFAQTVDQQRRNRTHIRQCVGVGTQTDFVSRRAAAIASEDNDVSTDAAGRSGCKERGNSVIAWANAGFGKVDANAGFGKVDGPVNSIRHL